ncbi:MAG: HlyD family efflux transporter periplasmic adaptor subunit [Cytophagales bacterium]|nr:MAG: HlyD family efflux transporter periplasmic adaptor subunit [Cytophagales bacterium]
MEEIKLDSDLDKVPVDRFYSLSLIRTPRLAKNMTYWAGGLFIMLNLFTLLPWTQNINSRGVITTLNPEERPQTIQSTISGRIEKWHVHEGEFVRKGDTIVTLSEIKDKFFDPEMLLRIDEQVKAKVSSGKSTLDKAKALTKQIAALKSALEYSLNKAQNKILQSRLKITSDSMDLVAVKVDFEVARLQYERQEKLYNQGLKSLTELEQRKLKFQEVSAKRVSVENKLFASRNELNNSIIELSSLKADYTDKISKAESEYSSTLSYAFTIDGEVAKMKNEYKNMQIRSSFYQILAPKDGYVVKALKAGIGETVKEGEPITSIIMVHPELAVALYVKPMDIPLLTIGRRVRLQFDGWPTLVFSGWPGASFGTFAGLIAVIDNMDTYGKYRILVVPDPNEEPWPHVLRVGTGADGWAMLNDVPIYFEIWRQLNGFPPDYMKDVIPQDPEKMKSDKDKDKE